MSARKTCCIGSTCRRTAEASYLPGREPEPGTAAPEGWLLAVILANHDQNLVLGLFFAAYQNASY
jgi:hypothetical protein